MTFLDQIELDNAVYFDKTNGFAVEITYDGATILAVEDGGAFWVSGDPGVMVGNATLYIKAADVAEPKQGDPVVFNSINYTVTGFPVFDGGIWMISLNEEVKNTVSV